MAKNEAPTQVFEALAEAKAGRVVLLRDDASGLRAVIALDSLVLGPACGGIRTRAYSTDLDAITDAQKLAAAMTMKCAIAGLPAGGGKTVVIEHADMDRPAAFRRLGRFIDDLQGLYRTAGDLGTTADDLAEVATATSHVDTAGGALAAATGLTVANCMEAILEDWGRSSFEGVSVAVQGCGLIGAGVARHLHEQGARLFLADTNVAAAQSLAKDVNGTILSPDEVLFADVDILCPCAIGGVVTEEVARNTGAKAICGGANNQLASASVAEDLAGRDITFVPDVLASSGAVIRGVSRMIGGLDEEGLIAATRRTAQEILARARSEGRTSSEVVTAMVNARLADATRLQG